MSFNLENKSFLVTGAGRGIGRELAKALSRNGAKVYALSRTKGPLDELVSICKNIRPIHADVRNWDDVKQKLAAVEPLDGLVNNAAIFQNIVPALECTRQDLIENMVTNFLGAVNCMQLVAKKMISSNKSGSFVNICDMSSVRAVDLPLGHCSSKAALEMATKQFALELGPHGIRVNSVNFTTIMTETAKKDISKYSMKKYVDNLILHTPLGRVGEVEDAIGPILYLLSDLSAMVSGTHHLVDGGLQSCLKNV